MSTNFASLSRTNSRNPPFSVQEFGLLVGSTLKDQSSAPTPTSRTSSTRAATPTPASHAIGSTTQQPSSSSMMSKIRRQASGLASSLSKSSKKNLLPMKGAKRASSSPNLVPVKTREDPPPLPVAAEHSKSPYLPTTNDELVFSFTPREGRAVQASPDGRRKGKRDPSPYLLNRIPEPFVVRARTSSYGGSTTNLTKSHSSHSSLSTTTSAFSFTTSTTEPSTSSSPSTSTDSINLPTPTSSHFPIPPRTLPLVPVSLLSNGNFLYIHKNQEIWDQNQDRSLTRKSASRALGSEFLLSSSASSTTSLLMDDPYLDVGCKREARRSFLAFDDDDSPWADAKKWDEDEKDVYRSGPSTPTPSERTIRARGSKEKRAHEKEKGRKESRRRPSTAPGSPSGGEGKALTSFVAQPILPRRSSKRGKTVRPSTTQVESSASPAVSDGSETAPLAIAKRASSRNSDATIIASSKGTLFSTQSSNANPDAKSRQTLSTLEISIPSPYPSSQRVSSPESPLTARPKSRISTLRTSTLIPPASPPPTCPLPRIPVA